MSDRSWLKNLPMDEYDIFGKTFLCRTRSLFRSLDTYDSTMPTSPSPGRIYKRNYNWFRPDQPGNWWVYLCVQDPDEPNIVNHVPYKLQIEPEIVRDLVVDKFLDA